MEQQYESVQSWDKNVSSMFIDKNFYTDNTANVKSVYRHHRSDTVPDIHSFKLESRKDKDSF